ncbi:hypothetical protein BRC77_13280 [Halobacteriales archaeon QH_8_64_26]|nr:MAG: hypothetical protein BRC77_13280 [Halobacteriales archaeon QH_8_64_26]
MLTRHLRRGLQAGAAGGLAFGLFVALLGNPLLRYVETVESFEGGHSHAHAHGGSAVGPETVGSIASVAGGVVFGVLLGTVAFGALYYLLEPAIPGANGTRSYLLGASGFLTVSGAPWLLFPPQPPGVEAVLATDVRVRWYLGMALAGALACGLAGLAYTRLRARRGRLPAVFGAALPFCVLPILAALGPAAPISSSVPAALAYVFRMVTVVGQVGLWFVLASTHAWLLRRDRIGEPESTDADSTDRTTFADTYRVLDR